MLVWDRINGAGGLAAVDEHGTETIYLDPTLSRRDRSAVLGHELVHLERGLLPDGTPGLVVAREEHQVREETASRMLPIEPLALWVARRAECEPITAQLVADELDVALEIADRSLARLRHPRSAGIRRRVAERIESERDGEGAA